jgi:site-specific DNA-methyltransferase (adenine-specific)
MEDAGLIMHPFIAWSFGSGFPKATRVNGATEFEGHRYGRQALKPAIEPILVFQKPYKGRPVDCITETGAGALWVDGGRVGTSDNLGRELITNPMRSWSIAKYEQGDRPNIYYQEKESEIIRYGSEEGKGRWPANLVLQHSPGCECAPQNGKETIADWRCVAGCPTKLFSEDSARFFQQVSTRLDEADPLYYCAKASRGEREAGLAGFDDRVAGGLEASRQSNPDHRLKDLRLGDEYERPIVKRRNGHPTVKPLDLTTYLATLLLPPEQYAPRRILVPFAGVASEMIGAWRAGWDEIVGIELSEEYCEIGRARLEHWRGVGVQASFA